MRWNSAKWSLFLPRYPVPSSWHSRPPQRLRETVLLGVAGAAIAGTSSGACIASHGVPVRSLPGLFWGGKERGLDA